MKTHEEVAWGNKTFRDIHAAEKRRTALIRQRKKKGPASKAAPKRKVAEHPSSPDDKGNHAAAPNEDPEELAGRGGNPIPGSTEQPSARTGGSHRKRPRILRGPQVSMIAQAVAETLQNMGKAPGGVPPCTRPETDPNRGFDEEKEIDVSAKCAIWGCRGGHRMVAHNGTNKSHRR